MGRAERVTLSPVKLTLFRAYPKAINSLTSFEVALLVIFLDKLLSAA